MRIHAAVNERVSIIIPCYQQGQYLAEAVESVLTQTRPADEIIIINDGSTDATSAVAGAFVTLGRIAPGGGCVRLIEQKNKGLSMARQAGLDAASGELLVALDADDALEPDMLERCLLAFQRHPEADAVVGDALLVSEGLACVTGRLRHRRFPGWPAVLEYNPIGAMMTVMLRAETVRRIGGFGLPGVRACEDWDLWARMSRCGLRFVALGRPVARYRQHGGGLSRRVQVMLYEKIRLLERCATDDPRLASPDLQPASPIAHHLYERLRNAVVFHALGIAVGEGLGADEARAITDQLVAGTFDPRACANQFLYGLQYAMSLKDERAQPNEAAFTAMLPILLAALDERGLKRHFAFIAREMRREMRDWRKRFSLARRFSRLSDRFRP